MTHSKLPPTSLDIAIAEKNKSLQARFLKEWTPAQFDEMQHAIAGHFSGKYFSSRYPHYQPSKRTFEEIGEIFGLAYTSSSAYAGYWICNDEIVCSKYAPYHYVGFALSQDGKAYGILWDKDENEIIIPL